jgi:hypothetical protein
MTHQDTLQIFERLSNKDYAPLMQDGLDLLARTITHANGMKVAGTRPGNIAHLTGVALGAWDQIIYNAALGMYQPERIADSLSAVSSPFIELSDEARELGDDYFKESLSGELSVYGGAFLHFPGNILRDLGINMDPETVNDRIQRDRTIMVNYGIVALTSSGLDSARRFYDKHKACLNDRLVIPE